MLENVQSLEPTVSRGDRARPNGSYGSCSGMDQHMFVFNVLAAKAPGLHTP